MSRGKRDVLLDFRLIMLSTMFQCITDIYIIAGEHDAVEGSTTDEGHTHTIYGAGASGTK